jgi:hypothetical protein
VTVRQLEKKIQRLEGFRVRLRHDSGRDVRSDLNLGRDRYDYRRMMMNRAHVRGWIDGRFRLCYPDYQVDVLLADGTRAHGNYRLATVRDTYLDA